MSDPWGPAGSASSAPAPTGAVRAPRSAGNRLVGLVTTFVGIALVLVGGIWQLGSDQNRAVNDLSQYAPILVLVVGLIVLFLGLRSLNRARGRRGLS